MPVTAISRSPDIGMRTGVAPTDTPASAFSAAVSGNTTGLVQQLVSLLQQLLTQLSGSGAGGSTSSSHGAGSTGADLAPLATQLIPLLQQVGQTGGTSTVPAAKSAPQPGASNAPAPTPAAPSTSAGDGPNTMEITNTQSRAITVGKFKNGDSTTVPSAEITLQPGQTGTLHYANGEAGFAAQADASGKFQSNASRLEYEADPDGKMKYPDVSYIDGRNASISLTDGAGLNKGDSKSIAAGAPQSLVTTDSAGSKTIAGCYDGSTSLMQAGGAYMQSQLGTAGAYLHPNDDTSAKNQNPMSATQSATLKASFGNA